MSKVTIIKCSDYESNRLVEGIKNGTAEQEYQPFRGPGKVYEFELLRIDQPKKEVTIGGSPNVIWPHPDMKHGIKEVIVQVESLKKKLRLEASGTSCRIIEESTQRGPGYRFEILAK